MLFLFLIIPLAALVLLNLPLGSWLRRMGWGLALALTALQAGVMLYAPQIVAPGSGPVAAFLALRLTADDISRILLLTIGIVSFAVLLIARDAVQDEGRRANFVNVLLLALIGMNGTVLLSDVFSLYVFMEITSVCSFILIASDRDRNGLEGAFKYIILSAVATVLMLTGVALLLVFAGGTSFDEVRQGLLAADGNLVARVAMGAFVCGLLVKGGLVPFHGWVPDAYSAAPAPVGVLLAGIATKASGVYALVRLVTSVLPPSAALNEALLVVGLASVVVGALAALGQNDMRRLLAYSSISQVGYIILGLGCGTALGLAGAVLHLFNHAIFKALLFVNAAAVKRQLGTTDMRRMGGLGSRMPVTGASCAVGALSTAGVPPLSGFWSKLIVIIALWQSHHQAYAVAGALFSVVTLAYMLTMQRKVFFGRTPESLAAVKEAPMTLVAPAVLLAGVTIGVGALFPLLMYSLWPHMQGLW